jgi:hypothetical protein
MPGLDTLENIGLGAVNLTGALGTMWIVLKWVFAVGLLGFVFYWFILRPLRYKDIIDVWDITAGGIVNHPDRGYWKEQKSTGEGEYILLKNKKARLKHPDYENAILTRKGKYKFTFLKHGPGPFDYSVIPPTMVKSIIPPPIPLADEDWAKHSIKKAAEKNRLSGWFNENKGFIITVTAMVMAVVLMITLIPAAKEAALGIASSNQESIGAMQSIAEQLERVAEQLGSTVAGTSKTLPPPGL